VGRDDSRGFLFCSSGVSGRRVAHVQREDVGEEEDKQGPAPKGVEERLLGLILGRRRGGGRRRGWGVFPLLLGGVGHPWPNAGLACL